MAAGERSNRDEQQPHHLVRGSYYSMSAERSLEEGSDGITRGRESNMTRMGIFRITIGVESHGRRGEVHELTDTMVDTGSEYTWISRTLLEGLGIPVERVERFVTADGRIITREMGYAIIHAGGARTSDEVVFADDGDMVLLGAHTIEGMNLRVDLIGTRLVPAGPVPAAVTGIAA
jgi:predicted aspartyl protease